MPAPIILETIDIDRTDALGRRVSNTLIIVAAVTATPILKDDRETLAGGISIWQHVSGPWHEKPESIPIPMSVVLPGLPQELAIAPIWHLPKRLPRHD